MPCSYKSEYEVLSMKYDISDALPIVIISVCELYLCHICYRKIFSIHYISGLSAVVVAHFNLFIIYTGLAHPDTLLFLFLGVIIIVLPIAYGIIRRSNDSAKIRAAQLQAKHKAEMVKQLDADIASFNAAYSINISPLLNILDQTMSDSLKTFPAFEDFQLFSQDLQRTADCLNNRAEDLSLSNRAVFHFK